MNDADQWTRSELLWNVKSGTEGLELEDRASAGSAPMETQPPGDQKALTNSFAHLVKHSAAVSCSCALDHDGVALPHQLFVAGRGAS